jgi:hypothetical protein
MNLLKRNHCVDSDRCFADETPSADTATKAPSAINAPGFARMLPPLLSVIAGFPQPFDPFTQFLVGPADKSQVSGADCVQRHVSYSCQHDEAERDGY